MKTLLWFLAVCILYSCERDNNNHVINNFPSVLIFDSCNIINTEVFNIEGKLTVYDERFDEFEFMPFWVHDSIVIVNKSLSIAYQRLNLPFSIRVDSFYLDMSDNYFKTIPVYPPRSIRVIDTRSLNNERTVNDVSEIKSALIWTYEKNEVKFRVALTAIRVFSKTEGGYDIYKMIAQSCAISVDRENLYKNLESNETLSLVNYELIFTMK